MRFVLMIEPQQGLSYGQQVAIAKRAEANGFEALFRSDHYASFPGRAGQPTTDAWTVLAGLARETDRIGLGALVSPVTFRHPGAFAKIVTTADEMSGGRIEVGVGAGWNELEHRQLGLAFPPIGARMDLLEDQLAILHGLWGEPDGWSYEGRTVSDPGGRLPPEAGGGPRPTGRAQRRRPADVIYGGSGAPRSSGWRRVRGRVQHALVRPRPGVAETYAKLDAACAADRPRSGDDHPLRDGRRPRRADRRRGARARGGDARGFGEDAEGGEAWLEERRDRVGLRYAGPRPARWSGGSRRPAPNGSCSRTSSRGISTYRRDGRGSWSGRSRSRDRISPRPRSTRPHSAGRRGGSGPGSVPRARASRSVSSWSGVAVPRSAATAPAARGLGGTTAGRPASGRRRAHRRGRAARIAAARTPRARAAREGLASPATRSVAPSRSARMSDERGLGSGRREVPVEERLEVAVGRRAARTPPRP